jgi:hypothetical protein
MSGKELSHNERGWGSADGLKMAGGRIGAQSGPTAPQATTYQLC